MIELIGTKNEFLHKTSKGYVIRPAIDKWIERKPQTSVRNRSSEAEWRTSLY